MTRKYKRYLSSGVTVSSSLSLSPSDVDSLSESVSADNFLCLSPPITCLSFSKLPRSLAVTNKKVKTYSCKYKLIYCQQCKDKLIYCQQCKEKLIYCQQCKDKLIYCQQCKDKLIYCQQCKNKFIYCQQCKDKLIYCQQCKDKRHLQVKCLN